jgi:diaminohydroxyphosphoribosylaminopyrimidine deaminase/5-amino-6-(5-phosphoribosylamino)uracil reductase
LAEGWHRRAGTAHAEADALAKVGGRAPGATMYVSLEPCAHRGGGRRTAPCAPLIAASGIARLVYGLRDPYPGHGGGAAEVARAGIAVDGPILEDECARANAPFIVFATQRRAHVTLKAAMTLDGRIATASGESRWITGEAARADAHRRRDRADAILVGVGTVLADDPQLTTRGVRGGRDATRVVVDGKLRTPPNAALLASGSTAATLIATTRDAPARRAAALERAGAELLRLPSRQGKIDLGALARALAERNLLAVLVEGGAETHAAFLDARLCDRLLLYIAPKVIGGVRAPSWVGGQGVLRLSDAVGFAIVGAPRRLGDDLLVVAEAARGRATYAASGEPSGAITAPPRAGYRPPRPG